MSLFDKDELSAFLTSNKERYEGQADADKLTRREFLSWLTSFTAEHRGMLSVTKALNPLERDERVAKGKEDFDFFRRTYFSHYYTINEESVLQSDLKQIYHRIREKRNDITMQGEKWANAAPRGFGKSTDVSVVFILWCIAYKLKDFATIFSDAIELTETLIETIKIELESNEALKADFPSACGIGDVWRVGEFVSRNNVKVKGYGSGKRVRGVKHGAFRVDLVIVDDLENDENVRSRTQRDKLEDWFDSAIDNLGSVENRLDIIFIGTIIHRDSVLARKLKLAFWNPKIYKALVKYPERMDLWDEYSTLYRKVGLLAAHAFYISNKAKMDAGTQLLWNAVSLESLMQKRATNQRAFQKEQQNRPGDLDSLFDSAKFKTITATQAPRYDRLIAYTDFKGDSKEKKGDYTTIIAGGIVEKERKLYVFLTHRERVKGKKAVELLTKYQKAYRFGLVGGETNGGFFLYKEWYKDMCREKGIDEGQLKFTHMKDSKESRIETLEYPLDEEDIIFVGEHQELFNELDDFPEAEHDDLSDGLAGLYRISKLSKKQSKKRTRYQIPQRKYR
ncbi:MAG: hypothetical protein PHI02_07040 [Sulfurovaceae bacterium]|nr:hypothetical protein [Sulfurovaceae bacterium]